MLAYQRGQTPLCFEARLEDRKERMASSERGKDGIDYHENPCTVIRLEMRCVCQMDDISIQHIRIVNDRDDVGDGINFI